MTRIILFYKKEERWYAEIPEYIAEGGTEADCEMVLGADKWLEEKSEGQDRIILKVSTEDYKLGSVLAMVCADSDGAVYYLGENPQQLLWLCNVSKYVFGKHPITIHYKILKDGDI